MFYKSKDFFQRSKTLSDRAHYILSAIEYVIGPETNRFQGPLRLIAAASGVSIQKIRRGVQELYAAGFISIRGVGNKGREYILTYLYEQISVTTSDLQTVSVITSDSQITSDSKTPLDDDDVLREMRVESRSSSTSIGKLVENGVFPGLAKRLSHEYGDSWINRCLNQANDLHQDPTEKIFSRPGLVKFLVEGGTWHSKGKDMARSFSGGLSHDPPEDKKKRKPKAPRTDLWKTKDIEDWDYEDLSFYFWSKAKGDIPGSWPKFPTRKEPAQIRSLFRDKELTNAVVRHNIDWLIENWTRFCVEKKIEGEPSVSVLVGFWNSIGMERKNKVTPYDIANRSDLAKDVKPEDKFF